MYKVIRVENLEAYCLGLIIGFITGVIVKSIL